METIETLKEKLMPLYQKMLDECKSEGDGLVPFCVQWGRKYPMASGKNILFVGKATNGWRKFYDLDTFFNGSSDKRGFARQDQMTHSVPTPYFNANKSAFWRVIRQVTQAFYPDTTDWCAPIAWTDLYKLAPEKKGKPTISHKTRELQLAHCKHIFRTEIEALQPDIVVLLTSNWEGPFLFNLNGGTHTTSIDEYDALNVRAYRIGNRLFVAAPHPQGKREKEIANKIIEMIKKHSKE